MRLGAIALVAAGAVACMEPRAAEDGASTCGQCHGDGPSGAPPPDLSGETEHEARGVGAHRKHAAKYACSECHPAPAVVDTPTHPDGLVQVQFGDAARRGDARPKWDALALVCSGTYCHASVPGGADPAPAWTGELTVRDGEAGNNCGSCHGAPPPPPHPVKSDCTACHPGADGATHLDGQVQVAIQSCNGCHGDAQSIWPFTGAHRAHRDGAFVGRAVACGECHPVPAALGSPGHRDGTVDLKFGALATQGGRAPSYDRSAGTCANSYCHVAAAPLWTGGAPQAACGSCHALPPAAPHPQQAWPCQYCHTNAYRGDGLIRDTHVDGEVTF